MVIVKKRSYVLSSKSETYQSKVQGARYSVASEVGKLLAVPLNLLGLRQLSFSGLYAVSGLGETRGLLWEDVDF
jgi:hypothetical protein